MKIFLTVLCLFLVGTAAKGQLVNGYGIKLGMGNTNHTWHITNFNIDIPWDNNTGISARAFADFLNFSNFNIEGEIGYLQKGAKLDVYTNTVENPGLVIRRFTSRLDYVSAALMGKVKYNFGIFTPYLLLGPQFNNLTGKDIDPIIFGFYDRFNKSAWGYTAGAGSEIDIFNLNLLLEYRFEKDFSSNFDHSNMDVKNYSHSVLIGVKF